MDSQVIFLIIIGVIYFLNWLFRESGIFTKGSNEPGKPASGSPTSNRRSPSEEEMLRKVREALGLPNDAPPPRPQQPPAIPPAAFQQSRANPPPVPVMVAERLAQEVRREDDPSSRYRLNKQETEALARLESQTDNAYALDGQHRTGGRRRGSANNQKVVQWLKEPGNLRKAVLLREILGSPGGLHSSGK